MPHPTSRIRASRLALAALLLVALIVEGYFITTYPQPGLFGDPAGFLKVGRNLSDGLARIAHHQGVVDTFVSIRGSLFFAAAGSFYGLVDWLWPSNVQAIRWALLALNLIGFAGAYLLAKRLSGGSPEAGLLAVGLGILHPSFSTHLGRAYPDPLTGAFFVWSAAFFLRALQQGGGSNFALSSFLLSCGLLVRPQIMAPVLFVVVTLLAIAAIRAVAERRNVLALLVGLLPASGLWIGLHLAMAATADRPGREDDFAGRYGWTVFRATYPQGFWQYFETDGWEGPYRLRQEPFYRALEEAAKQNPALLTSSRQGYAFAAQYALRRPFDSLLLMLDNTYRIFDRPTNGYRWEYPLPVDLQLLVHRLIVLGALAQLALLAARYRSALPIFLIPLCLAAVHAFTFPWPRYSQPALLILIAAAAAFAKQAGSLKPTTRFQSGTLVLVLGLCAALPFLVGWSPEPARFVSFAAFAIFLAAPFVLIAGQARGLGPRLAPLAASLVLLLPAAAHQTRDARWHERRVSLSSNVTEVSQSIGLSASAVETMRRASETFVAFDLLANTGDISGLSISINGLPFRGADLIPTMPRFPESTTTGGRDPRSYPQWWVLPLPLQALAKEGEQTLQVSVRADAARPPVTLFGDRHREEQTVYEGPSFGDFPRAVALKLEYDGDYRIPVRHTLVSDRTESLIVTAKGERKPSGMIFRIRLLTLRSNEGGLRFETEPARGAQTSWGFFAWSGSRGEAQMASSRLRPIRFPLGSLSDFSINGEDAQLCYRSRGERGGAPYGGYVLTTARAEAGQPETLEVSFRSGMSVEAMHFHLDGRATAPDLAQLFKECGDPAPDRRLAGLHRIIDASRNSYPDDTGKWQVAEVF